MPGIPRRGLRLAFGGDSTCAASTASTFALAAWYYTLGASNNSGLAHSTTAALDLYIDLDLDNLNSTTASVLVPQGAPTKQDRFRLKLKRNLQLPSPRRTSPFPEMPSPRELKALSLLKQLVSPYTWRRYLRDGSISVKAPSGLTYYIHRSRSHVQVWQRSVRIAELCLDAKPDVPPTDAVILKLLLAESDEPALWARSNVHGSHRKTFEEILDYLREA